MTDPATMALVRLGALAAELDQLDRLGAAQCPDDEVAAYLQRRGSALDVTAPAVRLRLGVARLAGAAEIRLAQLELVRERNPGTVAWLGRQYLGHSTRGVASVPDLVRHLRSLPRHQVRQLLERALASFDATTTTTSKP